MILCTWLIGEHVSHLDDMLTAESDAQGPIWARDAAFLPGDANVADSGVTF